MKQIQKNITIWSQFWSKPEYILRDVIILLAVYGFVRLGMDLWSWLA